MVTQGPLSTFVLPSKRWIELLSSHFPVLRTRHSPVHTAVVPAPHLCREPVIRAVKLRSRTLRASPLGSLQKQHHLLVRQHSLSSPETGVLLAWHAVESLEGGLLAGLMGCAAAGRATTEVQSHSVRCARPSEATRWARQHARCQHFHPRSLPSNPQHLVARVSRGRAVQAFLCAGLCALRLCLSTANAPTPGCVCRRRPRRSPHTTQLPHWEI